MRKELTFMGITVGLNSTDEAWSQIGLDGLAGVLERSWVRPPRAILNVDRVARIADALWKLLELGLAERNVGLVEGAWKCLAECGGAWYDSPPKTACRLEGIRTPSGVFSCVRDTFKLVQDPTKFWELTTWVLAGSGYFAPDVMVFKLYNESSPPSRQYMNSLVAVADWLVENPVVSSLAASRVEDEWFTVGVRDRGIMSAQAVAESGSWTDQRYLRKAMSCEISSLESEGGLIIVNTPFHRVSLDRVGARVQAARTNASLNVVICANRPVPAWSPGHWFTQVRGEGIRVSADNFATIQLPKNVVSMYHTAIAAKSLVPSGIPRSVFIDIPEGIEVVEE